MLDSTIWFDRDAREVFITALLMAEPIELREEVEAINVRSLEKTGFTVPVGWYGKVGAAGSGIVRRAGLEIDHGLDALERLGEPEKESRTPDFGGRRMVRVDGGYLILNYDKYRQKDHTAAERSRRYREKRLSRVTNVAQRVTSRSVTQAEAEAEAYSSTKSTSVEVGTIAKSANSHPTIEEVKLVFEKSGGVAIEAEKFFNFYSSKGWLVGKTKMRSMPHAVAGWLARSKEPKPGTPKRNPAWDRKLS